MAILLVVAVVIVFLQTWRASLIPVVAIPVSLIGAFTVLAALGFSLNNLSLFGLVLAVGIVVDDAIVVVENVERNIAAGLSPREAAHRTMDEVGGALIAIALTLCAVFVPTAFISGISGQFFRQFAVTIAASTLISCVVSLTLSPALCALLFRPHATHAPASPSLAVRAVRAFFAGSTAASRRCPAGYGRLTTRLVRALGLVLLVYAGLIALTAFQFARAPTGFIPEQDQGYAITVLQLPPGASLDRSDRVLRQVVDIMLHTPGVAHAVPFTGLDATTFTDASNSATVFATFDPFEQRVARGLSGDVIIGELRQRLSAVQGAFVLTIAPPPVQGIGSAGGFKMMVEDRTGQGRRRSPPPPPSWWRPPTGARSSPACSPCSAPARPRCSPTSTASGRRSSGSPRPRCSTRCRSIWARPTSTTSTISAAPTRWWRRPTGSSAAAPTTSPA